MSSELQINVLNYINFQLEVKTPITAHNSFIQDLRQLWIVMELGANNWNVYESHMIEKYQNLMNNFFLFTNLDITWILSKII